MRDRATGQRTPRWKYALLGLLAVAVTGGLVVGMIALDWREDRERPLYHDVILMAGLQYDLLRGGHDGLELSIGPGDDPVLLGDESFAPLPGVKVVVEQRGESYCVMGSNQYGDETRWVCVDGTGERPDLGVLEDEF